MTQEDKQILLQDLCARLPYGIYANLPNHHLVSHKYIIHDINIQNGWTTGRLYCAGRIQIYGAKVEDCLLYLRPMSSMTEEENGELWFLLTEGRTNIKLNSNGQLTTRENIELGFNYPFVCPEGSTLYIDWLNAHHFDYRNLIKRGLAIEAPRNMYAF